MKPIFTLVVATIGTAVFVVGTMFLVSDVSYQKGAEFGRQRLLNSMRLAEFRCIETNDALAPAFEVTPDANSNRCVLPYGHAGYHQLHDAQHKPVLFWNTGEFK